MTVMNSTKVFVAAIAALAVASCGQDNSSSTTTSGGITLDPSTLALGDVIMGDPNAPVEIIEYASVTCGHCAEFHENVMPVIEEYVEAGQVKYIFRDFPTPPADVAMAGFAIARCAGEDGYYDVLDDLFENQTNIFQAIRTGTAGDALRATAARHGLDDAEFRACTRDRNVFNAITSTMEAGQARGVSSTPTIYLDGELQTGIDARTPDGMAALIDAALGIEPEAEAAE
ncbi:MAG: hypothetical protein CBB65_13675 [Hyphomonadaceae bacterium TMED5]|nr:disulfide bond formation protein DsbA [Ponticaulis sp.]OUX97839.1 MAG: hypothetical protein CBB65_13675 [Hyphomonadaceae bacterium TMED5]|tara:strand:- start:5664 stop:6350 length:687 start_codon:yes stop_codon:yes gene_type:complete